VRIAVLAGDGVGPEVIAEAVKVLRALGGLKLDLHEAPVGGAGYDASGDPLPEATLALAKKADAVLFGAVGDAKYDSLPREKAPRAVDPQAAERARPVRQPPARFGFFRSSRTPPRSGPTWWPASTSSSCAS